MTTQPYQALRLPMPRLTANSELRDVVLATHRLATFQLAELCVAAAPGDRDCERFLSRRRRKWLALPLATRQQILARYK